MAAAGALFAQAPFWLLPADNAVNGWVKGGGIGNCLSASATDTTTLRAVIDGGANVYSERDYAGSVYDGYDNTVDTICVEIYNQTVHDSALSVFKYWSLGQYEVLHGLGDTAKLDTSPAFVNKIELVTGQYYIRLYLQSKDRALVAAGRQLAQQIAANAISVEKGRAVPVDGMTIMHYPDPSNSGFTIEVPGAGSGAAFGRILDCRGSLVRELQFTGKGGKALSGYWDGKDSKGLSMPAGVYMVSIKLGNSVKTAKFVLGR
jgi:hypothetical protein